LSHGLTCDLWLAWFRHGGALPHPGGLGDLGAWLLVQAVFAVTLPGDQQLDYRCNPVWSWYRTLALGGTAHMSGLYTLDRAFNSFGPLIR
jgi:hypothetical protein